MTEWAKICLGDVCQFASGTGFPERFQGNASGKYPFIKVSDLTAPGNEREIRFSRNWIDDSELRKLRAKLHPPGSVVFAKVGAALKLNRRRLLSMPTAIDNNLMAAVPDPDRIDTDFLLAFLNTQDLGLLSQDGAVPSVNQSHLNSIALHLPPLPEQRRIAAILGTWDAAIEKAERLLGAAQRQFEALRTELYREDGSEERSNFRDFLDESRIPGNDGSTARKLTVRLYGKGIGPKQDRTAGSANTRYYIRRAGQFIYSRLDFLNGAFAVVPDHLDGFQSTLDLPAFDIAPRVNPIWLLNYVTRPAYYENQQNLARGQRIARRVNPDDLLASEVAVPTRERQDEIAAILTLCIDEINSTKSMVAALRRQKSGLMQKLLTGKIRVPEAIADLSPAAD